MVKSDYPASPFTDPKDDRTIGQYPDGTWWWLDETWNYGTDIHYKTREEAAQAQLLYCIEVLG